MPFGSPQISASVTAPVERSTRTRWSGAVEMPWPRNVPAYRSLPAPLSRNQAAPPSMTASQP